MKPYFTTTQCTRSKKELTPSQQAAKNAHEKWLKAQGVHPDQLKKRVAKKLVVISKSQSSDHLSNKIVDGGRVHGIMANLHNEPAHVQNAILDKARRVEAAYNKGPLVYVTDGMDIKEMGSRSRRPG